MSKPSEPSSARCRGLTLVELLAGLVVLGTLLTCVVAARGRFLEQWGHADRKLAAARELETLITTWLDRPASMPRVPSEGSLSSLPTHRWQTRYVADPGAASLSTRILRIEVVPNAGRIRQSPTALIAVELLMRDDRLSASTQPAEGASP